MPETKPHIDAPFRYDGKPAHPVDAMAEFGLRLAPFRELWAITGTKEVPVDQIMESLQILGFDYDRLKESVLEWIEDHVQQKNGGGNA